MKKTSKNFTNREIAKLLKSIAAAYEIKGEKENRFRIIAYDRAASAVEHLTSEIKDIWEDNKLSAIPGVGSSLSQYLDELFRTGKSKHFQEVVAGFPPAMFELLDIRGIGPKTAHKLCLELGIKQTKNAVTFLKKAAESEKIKDLPSFGKDSEQRILKAIKEYIKIGKKKKRMLFSQALFLSKEIIRYLKKNKFAKEVHPLGSLRRKVATVGDIDIAVSSNDPKKVISHFSEFRKVKRVLASGKRDASVLLNSGHQIDLKIQPPESFGALLQHYTGSKHHNIRLRELAKKKGLSLSEYGIRGVKSKRLKKFSSEKDFYNFLGLDWVPPELRENSGEIEAAQKHQLPNLVNLKDIKGDLHIHSNFDVEPGHDLGQDSMEDIVKRAVKLNYRYLAFSEHNPSFSRHSPKEIIEIIKRKDEYILKNRELWKSNFNIYVFNSLEIDIKPDGTLAIPDKAFEHLDFATVSIHSAFHLPRDKMTQRIIKGLNHPKAKVLCHPTGRIIGFREAYEIDWDLLFEFCKKNNKLIEINSSPDRLDLSDILAREAIKNDLKIAINTDSHQVGQLDFMPYGVAVARRGWVEKKDVVNTFPLKKLCQTLGLDC